MRSANTNIKAYRYIYQKETKSVWLNFFFRTDTLESLINDTIFFDTGEFPENIISLQLLLDNNTVWTVKRKN